MVRYDEGMIDAIALVAMLAAAPAGTVPTVDARPGAVVRWSGAGITSCRSGDRIFAPLGGACYFPVDLDDDGVVEVSRRRGGRTEQARIRVGEYPYAVQRLEVEEKMVHLSPEDAERARRESVAIAALWRRETRPRFALPLGAPLADMPRGGRFGARRVFNGEPRSPHSGADYAAAAGTPVRSAGNGVVALAGDFFFSGNSVFVDHGDGLVTMYFHLSRIDVREGDEVRRGQVIGLVGSTGRSTGAHLHFGARWHGARVDPSLLLGSPAALPSVQH